MIRVSDLKRRSTRLALAGSVMALATLAMTPALLLAQDSILAPRAKGMKSAPVTIYEMGDFQCPVCKKFEADAFPTIEKEYIATGKVYWVFIQYPLTQIHPNAEAAAEFAACSAKQGKFWKTHDLLYAMQDTWAKLKDPTPFFTAQIEPLGLKRDVVLDCLKSGVGRETVFQDTKVAARTGATGTPTFWIEGGMVSGYYPLATMKMLIDSVYKAKTTPKKP